MHEPVDRELEIEDDVAAFGGAAPGEPVDAFAALQLVHAHPAMDQVVAAAADHPVVTGVAVERVVALAAAHLVVATPRRAGGRCRARPASRRRPGRPGSRPRRRR